MHLYLKNTVKSKSIHLILKLYLIGKRNISERYSNNLNNGLKCYVEIMKTVRVAFIRTTDKYPCKDTSACLNSGDTPASFCN